MVAAPRPRGRFIRCLTRTGSRRHAQPKSRYACPNFGDSKGSEALGAVTEPDEEGRQPLADARWASPEYVARRYAYRPGSIWLGRNPHNPAQAIGHTDDRHIFVCAETGGGKGRAFMVNNQVLWPGSLISVGPKGEEATIAAPRRGAGNEFCDGLGQEVYVLDPMRACDVPESMRAHFNPLAAFNPSDGELVSKVDRVANAICKLPESGEALEWSRKGRDFVANVILHVVTSPHLAEEDRHLLTVRDLVLEGSLRGARALHNYKTRLARESGDTSEQPGEDPHRVLLDEMIENTGSGGAISRYARDLKNRLAIHAAGFESVRMSAASHVRFLEGEGITRTVAPPFGKRTGYQRTFEASDLRGDKPISVFLTLPEQNYEPLDRWLRAMVQILVEALQQRQGIPASGHRVLFCIDEFANLGKMEVVERAANSLRGSGTKLMLATQRLGDLIRLYGPAWEKFVSSAGVQVWFNVDELESREYLERKLGRTEVVKFSRSASRTAQRSDTTTASKAYTHTESSSDTSTTGEARGTSETRGQTSGRSTSEGGSDSNYTTKSRSKGASRGYGPHLFFPDMEHTLQRSLQRGESRGAGSSQTWTSGTSSGESSSWSSSSTRQTAESKQRGTSESRQDGTSRSVGRSDGVEAGASEQFHIRPLLSALDVRRLLISPSEPDHPAFPGFALILLAEEENPFFVRKANHDQDAFFVRKFHPNPAFPFVPLKSQPLFGWEITSEHFYTVAIPQKISEKLDLEIKVLVYEDQRLPAGISIFTSRLQGTSDQHEVYHSIDWAVKVATVFDSASESNILQIRFEFPILSRPTELTALESQLWRPWLALVADLESEERRERLRQEYEQAAALAEKRIADALARIKQESEAIESTEAEVSVVQQKILSLERTRDGQRGQWSQRESRAWKAWRYLSVIYYGLHIVMLANVPRDQWLWAKELEFLLLPSLQLVAHVILLVPFAALSSAFFLIPVFIFIAWRNNKDEERISALDKEIKSAIAQRSSLQTRIDTRRAEIASSYREIETLEAEVNGLRAAAAN